MAVSSPSSSSEEFEFEGSPPHQAHEDGSTGVPEEVLESLQTATSDIKTELDQPATPSEAFTSASTAQATISISTAEPVAEYQTSTSSPPEAQSKTKSKSVKSKAGKKPIANKKQKTIAKTKKPVPKAPKKTAAGSKKAVVKGNAAVKGKAVVKGKTVIKGKAAAKGKPVSSRTDSKSEAPPSDLFTKHYREFERCLIRLEKVDLFGYFLDTAPEEFDENYTTTKATTIQKNSEDAVTEKEFLVTNTEACPSDGLVSSTKYPNHAPFNWEMIRRRHDQGRYILDIKQREAERCRQIAEYLRNNSNASIPEPTPVPHGKGVNWELFKEDVIAMCNSTAERNPGDLGDGKAGSLSHAVKKVLGAMEQIYERTGCRHIQEITLANDRHQFGNEVESTTNTEAAFQGKWRQKPFPERKYERLSHKNVVCDGLSELDERIACYEQRTNLPDSFVGVSYKYEDDTGKSEGWMKSVLWETGGKKKAEEAAMALAEDDGVIRAQVTACMEMLLVAVQDKCLTEADILHQPELRSANWEEDNGRAVRRKEPNDELVRGSASTPDIVEQPVWGIDCYTRRNVQIALQTEFDEETVLVFIEKWLLPAINACPVDLACDIGNAALILEGLPFAASKETDNGEGSTSITATEERWSHSLIGKSLKNKIQTTGPPWLKMAAQLLRRAREAMGPDFFRVHPKGHGSIVISPSLEPNTLVTFYRGEVYPSWRWGEKMDAIDITQARKKLKPALPDFYNMALERPQKDPRKYGLLFVDASRKAGHGSSVSHSCAPTCEVRVAAVGGELCLAMTTLRRIEMGEELTFDYNAVTESLVEYRSAVCLCGYGKCRGSFLHFATADCYQEVLKRNAPIAVRFASLAKGSMKEVLSAEDERTLRNHGFMTAAFGAIAVNRHKASVGQAKDEMLLDSMDIVPIWLGTYVADTLRYIEYERRALPISLICEDLSKPMGDATCTTLEVKGMEAATTDGRCNGGKNAVEETDNDKPAKASKPMPTFFFYCRANDPHFRSVLKNEEGLDEKALPGLEFNRAIRRVAGAQWKLLSAEEKVDWKKKAERDWAKQNGQTEAALRKKSSREGTDTKSKPKSKKARNKKRQSLESKLESSNVSFQAADAEGAAAMEQRIQQLAQSLSRVGRVLDRHREALHVAGPEASCETLRSQVHSPLMIATDEQTVAWLWNGDGVVPTLMARIESEEGVSPSLKSACADIKKKHEVLDSFGCHWSLPEDFPIRPCKARKKLASALMEFRKAILKDLRAMARDLKKEKLRVKAERKRLRQEEKAAKVASFTETTSELQYPGRASPVTPTKIHENSEHSVENEAHTRQVEYQSNEKGQESYPTPDCPSSPVEAAEQPTAEAKASTDGASIESSTATPSLLVEDTNDVETPAVISREVSSEVETAMADCAADVGASHIAEEGVPSPERPMTPLDSRVEERAGVAVASVNPTMCDARPIESNPSIRQYSDVDEARHEDGDTDEIMKISRDIADIGEVELKTEVSSVMRYIVDTVVALAEKTENSGAGVKNINCNKAHEDDDDKPKPWLKHYGQRHKLQAAADLLLLYAKTSTFFLMKPYKPLESTPIEVYAREIGNAVPRSVIDKSVAKMNKATGEQAVGEQNGREQLVSSEGPKPTTVAVKSSKKRNKLGKTDTLDEDLCEPDDVVAEVTVTYQGDYVLSQLLQWYNAGIGQSPGLPETIGCIRLPPMSGCWGQNGGNKPDMEKPTHYESRTRPALVNWFSDPHQRGSPWPKELKDAFSFKGSADLPSDTSHMWLPLGSPVLDLLVTGDDSNILSILDEFGADESKKRESGLLSTVDEGRPAQAVSNWIQCEACGKWRRMAWYVDIDVLATGFVCSDNKWNKKSASCDAPEDDYAEAENDVVDYASPLKPEAKFEAKKDAAGRPVKALFQSSDGVEATMETSVKQVEEESLVVGARFDVLRKGKSKFCVGIVREVETEHGSKKIKFHFPKLQSKHDEYIEIGRIAPLYSKVKPPEKRTMSGPKPESKRLRLDDNGSGKALAVAVAIRQSLQMGSSPVRESAQPQPKMVESACDNDAATSESKADSAVADGMAASICHTSSCDAATNSGDGVRSSATGRPKGAGATLFQSDKPDALIGKPESAPSAGGAELEIKFRGTLKKEKGNLKKEKKERKKKDKEKKRKRGAPCNAAADLGAPPALATSTKSSTTSALLAQEAELRSQRNKQEETSKMQIQATQAAPLAAPLASQMHRPPHLQQPDDVPGLLRAAAAAAGLGNEAFGALAGLASLKVPRKPRSATDPSNAPSFLPRAGGAQDTTNGSQFALAQSNIRPGPESNGLISNGHYAQQSVSHHTHYNTTHVPEPTNMPQRLVAPGASEYFAAMDNQRRLQRIQDVQNAMNVEIHRQRIQQQMQIQAEFHRQRLPLLQSYTAMERGNVFSQGGASRPAPNNQSQEFYLQHENFPDSAPDYRYGYPHHEHQNGGRR